MTSQKMNLKIISDSGIKDWTSVLTPMESTLKEINNYL